MKHGLYGRCPALIPAGIRDLTYYAAGALPKPPAKVAVPVVPSPGDGTAWGSDGNDRYGDCGVAGFAHGTMADVAVLSLKGYRTPDYVQATADQCVSYYLSYTDGADNGVVLSQFLAHVKNQGNGFYGQTVKAYAPVSIQDIPTLQFTIDAFGFAYTGIVVTQAMEQAFENGQPWTMETLNSPVAGGHCIILAGYDSQYLYGITWGSIVRIAYPAWHGMADEAWAVIMRSQMDAGNDGRGINVTALEADISKLAVL